MAPHILVQPSDNPVPLIHRNKFSRGYHPFIRVIPAHQRFRTVGTVRHKVYLWLQIHLKLFLINRPVDFIDDKLLLAHVIYHAFIIIGNIFVKFSLAALCRQKSPVIHF